MKEIVKSHQHTTLKGVDSGTLTLNNNAEKKKKKAPIGIDFPICVSPQLPYRGLARTGVGIVQEEGLLKLWQGVTPAVYRWDVMLL